LTFTLKLALYVFIHLVDSIDQFIGLLALLNS